MLILQTGRDCSLEKYLWSVASQSETMREAKLNSKYNRDTIYKLKYNDIQLNNSINYIVLRINTSPDNKFLLSSLNGFLSIFSSIVLFCYDMCFVLFIRGFFLSRIANSCMNINGDAELTNINNVNIVIFNLKTILKLVCRGQEQCFSLPYTPFCHLNL
jgi:hypothetical protein